MTALLIGQAEREAIAAVIQLAEANPVDIPLLLKRLTTHDGKREHRAQMTRQSIALPVTWLVTYSIETGHPAGKCRHMSMSCGSADRVPNQHALWMVAEELGFRGGLVACTVWPERLRGHGTAINVVQPFSS